MIVCQKKYALTVNAGQIQSFAVIDTSPPGAPNPAVSPVQYSFVVALSSFSGIPNSGTIMLLDNGNPIATQPVSFGGATFSPTLSQGTHVLTASYSGNATYTPCTTSNSFTLSIVCPGINVPWQWFTPHGNPSGTNTASSATVSPNYGWQFSIQVGGLTIAAGIVGSIATGVQYVLLTVIDVGPITSTQEFDPVGTPNTFCPKGTYNIGNAHGQTNLQPGYSTGLASITLT